MPYSKNPYLPRVRAKAVKMVRAGKSIRLTSRYLGVNAGTVSRWVKKSRLLNCEEIPTQSSAPKNPKKISRLVVDRVVKLTVGLTAAQIIKKLHEAGVKISLSSVKRIIAKNVKLKTQK